MFQPISSKKEIGMNALGEFKMIVDVDESISDTELLGSYNISYVFNDDCPREYTFFGCDVTSTDSMLVVRNLVARIKMIESTMYHFLYKVVECIENMAISKGKHRVVVETALPHCTEVLVDKHYEIVKKTGSNVFRAHKVIGG